MSVEKARKILAKREAQRILAGRRATQLLTPDTPFPPQEAFVRDKERYIIAQCGRRSGKTTGLALRFFNTMQAHPKSTCLYLALTLDSAMDILWPVLNELNDKYKLQCKFIESQHVMIHPNGAKLKIYGADMSNFIKRLKGQKSPGIAIDEAQDFGPHLQHLVDSILTPMMMDYSDPWLALTGTPGPVPSGYFFEASEKHLHGYSIHKWTSIDNPHLPNAEQFIHDLMLKRNWDEKNPTLQREWRNNWMLDQDVLWVKWKEETSNYTQLPPGNYTYIAGIDLGYKDADAIAVLGFADNSDTVYLIEEIITKKQGITDLAQQIQAVNAKYNFPRLIVDAGALGAKIVDELRTRHSLNVEAAEKQRKQENVELLNDALRTGKMRARSNSRFVQDSYMVEIDWMKSRPDKIVLKSGYHSDVIDAVLYAWKLSPAYAYAAEPPKPVYGSREWYQQQNDENFERAMEHFKKQSDGEWPSEPGTEENSFQANIAKGRWGKV